MANKAYIQMMRRARRRELLQIALIALACIPAALVIWALIFIAFLF
jgi:hypothetical protein